MAGKSTIEWTDATWNPFRGCTKISPGCKHCYAETFAERWRGVPGHAYERGFDPRFVPDQLGVPLRWKKPQRIFVNSMSDLFHEAFTFEQIAAVYGVMAACPHHTFQVLTKRLDRALEFYKWIAECGADLMDMVGETPPSGSPNGAACAHFTKFDLLQAKGYVTACNAPWPLPNVNVGASVEDRKYGVPRIDALREIPAAVHFLSIEPLLEDLGEIDLRGIDQAIVGAESGRGARGMNEDWVRSVRDQCVAQDVKLFYKQKLDARGRKVSLPMLDGRQWAESPEARA